MSAIAEAPAGLPPLFRRVVGVNPTLHAALRLDRGADYAFSQAVQSVPLGLAEFTAAGQHVPILFTASPDPTPVALLGLAAGRNLFVEPGGGWRAGVYVPAYIRAFPFVFLHDPATDTTHVGMEADAACITRDRGAPMFEDGAPTPALSEAISFCASLRDNIAAGAALGRALKANGLLEEEEATINFTAGGSSRIRGFKLVRADRLDQLEDGVFLEWRHRGWIAAIYAHLHSIGHWGRLIELAAPPATGT